MSYRQRCTAHRKKDGQPCGKWARKGYAVCAVHGAGYTERPGGAPMASGRYSRLQHARLREVFHQFLTDEKPLDLYGELAMLRALVQDFIDRYSHWRDALLAWHASFTWKPEEHPEETAPVALKPREVLDIADAYRILAEIGRMVERIDALERGPLLSQRDMANALRKMADVVDRHVEDEDVRRRIEEGWREIDYN